MTIAYIFAGVHSFDSSSDSPHHGPNGGRASRGAVSADTRVSSHHDAPIIARIQTGDHKAFGEVFLAYYDGLCRFAESYTRNPTDAEEIVEQVLARVWERHDTFSPSAGIGSYLYAAVRNRAINVIRDARARESWAAAHAEDVSVDAPPGMGMPPASMVAMLEREELGAVLHRVIERLPEHRRAVVTMRWFGGLSYAEIAAALGTSVNAVEIQLRRALKSLADSAPAYLRE